MQLLLKLIAGTALLFSVTATSPSRSAADQFDFARLNFGQRIHNRWVDIVWMPEQPEPADWKVLSACNGESPEWFSMQAPAMNNTPLSRHLRLHGRIRNLPLESTGNWVRLDTAGNPQTAIHQRMLSDGLLLEQSYALTDIPYHLRISFKLLNTTKKVYVPHPNDRIELLLGPGLGNQHSEGMGYADSLYSFVEPVAMIAGKVKRFHTKSAETTILPWADKKLQWLGLHGRYFAFLIAPAPHQNRQEAFSVSQVSVLLENETTKLPPNHLPLLSIGLPLGSILPGDSMQWNFVVFSGPKSLEALKGGALGFERLVFPGLWEWLRWLSFGLLWLIAAIQAAIPNWGVVIILLAVLVRVVMYPLSKKALASQKEFVLIQKRIQPELQKIKQDFCGEEQSERILKLYETHGVSPLAGIKPLLIVPFQLPILIALFHVLGSTYELHRAPFLWMETLAEPDKLFDLGFTIPFLGEYFNLLPVIMTVSTLAAMKLSPTPVATPFAKRAQNIGLTLFALLFLIIFYPFPAGLVLYWTVTNIVHIVQQRFSNHF